MRKFILEKQKKMKDKLTRELTMVETRFEREQAKHEEREKIRLEREQAKQEELEKTRLEQEQAKKAELEKISITALQKVYIS
ncbi:MAG: hypothetical protein V3V70_10395 [Candidatus Scalindua sp.]